MPDMFVVDRGLANEEKHDFASSVEGNGFDGSNQHQQINCQVVQSPSDVDTSSGINDQNGFDHLDPNVVAKCGGETLAKHRDFYAEKTIAEVPETTDPLNDGAYHVVKDIGIDETANAFEKLFEADQGQKYNPLSYNPFAKDEGDMNSEILEDSSHQNVSSDIGYQVSGFQEEDPVKFSNNSFLFNPFDTDGYDIGQNITHSEMLDLHGLRSPSINGSSVCSEHSDDFNQHSLRQNSKVVPESVAEVGPEDEVSALSSGMDNTREMMSHQNLDNQHIQEDASNLHSSDHLKQCNDSSNGNDQGNMENEETSNVRSATNFMTTPTLLEESNITKPDTVEAKAESKVVSCNFHSGEDAMSETVQSKKNTDGLPLGQILNFHVLEEATIDDQMTSSARSSFMHQSQGGSNLSSPASLSGRTFSVGIPYSGSISHRSDSSNTSARSFAFPILQSEWNSSPAKMAKADRRHLRKHRGWRMRLMCCRF